MLFAPELRAMGAQFWREKDVVSRSEPWLLSRPT
jgi:hypothetical protein